MNNRVYQVCTKCVMDTSDKDISFDESGVCNHCLDAEEKLRNYIFSEEQEQVNLQSIKKMILASKRGTYDCLIGVSGGVDSSYILYLAWKMGLNPLCVHFDNGWNSNIAVSNIEKMIQKCGFDLQTYVIDWPEFRDLQRAFFKAGVIDIEMLTDHAITAIMFKLARKSNLKFILSGGNYRTEHGLPKSWTWNKQDLRNIKHIHSLFGEISQIKNYPTLNSFRYVFLRKFKVIFSYVEILNKINYSKKEAVETLIREFGWENYGGKHYESVFTKFYQAYYLPKKFGYDKRRVHLSAQIRNYEITREYAVQELLNPPVDDLTFQDEKSYVLKKLGFTESEFDEIMHAKPKGHLYYKSDEDFKKFMRKIISKLSWFKK